LSIVRRIIELHGGSIKAESAGCGQGATFTVQLPKKPPVAVRANQLASNKPAEMAAKDSI
jgi:K+-sensing histidine kinase KdpD